MSDNVVPFGKVSAQQRAAVQRDLNTSKAFAFAAIADFHRLEGARAMAELHEALVALGRVPDEVRANPVFEFTAAMLRDRNGLAVREDGVLIEAASGRPWGQVRAERGDHDGVELGFAREVLKQAEAARTPPTADELEATAQRYDLDGHATLAAEARRRAAAMREPKTLEQVFAEEAGADV